MVTRWLVSIIINSVILIAIAGLFEHSFYIENIQTAVLASVILSVLNVLVKPLLIVITLPVTILSLGFFLFVINAITLVMASNLIGDAFEIHGFGTAILAAILISIFNAVLQRVVAKPLTKRK